ncbi:hypothetical protein FACS1894196_1650 [Clostridia bacterium]|nr:hypothetical protein FACS1894196_1650 [Clostridia bacterium]
MQRKIISALLAACLMLGAGLCGADAADAPKTAEITSYRDIPGVTQEEIDAIEAIRKSTPFLIYGMTKSTECFRDRDNLTSGFADLVCSWFTEIFGIQFKPLIYSWEALLMGLSTGDIAFSSEISYFRRDQGEYFMTDPIAERKILVIRLVGAETGTGSLTRPRRYGFLTQTITESLVTPHISEAFEPIIISDTSEAYRRLLLKEIDALFVDETCEGEFALNDKLSIEAFKPSTYNMVSIATRNEAYAPIISVIQKYMRSNGSYRFTDMYLEGNRRYQRYNLLSRLTNDEMDYMNAHQDEDAPIRVLIEEDNYPATFYNERDGAWQGIAVDVLREVESLTGMKFQLVSEYGEQTALKLQALQEGKVEMAMELIRAPSREGNFLWTETPYQTDRYVLISSADYQDIILSDVPYVHVAEDNILIVRAGDQHIAIRLVGRFRPEEVALARGQLPLDGNALPDGSLCADLQRGLSGYYPQRRAVCARRADSGFRVCGDIPGDVPQPQQHQRV